MTIRIGTAPPQKGMDIRARALQMGVVGFARIGKIHSKNPVTRMAGTELAVLADVFPDELNAVATRLVFLKKASDYKGIINLLEVETLVICTPTNTHYPIILDSAVAGKHVFCEKPIELSIDKIKDQSRRQEMWLAA